MNLYTPTLSQQLIWLDQASSKESAKYNIGGYAFLEGDLVYESFNLAVLSVLKSQEVYSNTFFELNGELRCSITEIPDTYSIGMIDFLMESSPESSAIKWMEEDFSKPFILTNTHLFHFKLLKISDRKHFWYAKIHHLIGDGYSFKLLLNQTAGFYSTVINGQPISFREYKYSEYALDDNEYYQSREFEADREFWLNEYAFLPEPLFPASNNVNMSDVAGSETLSIDVDLKGQLQALADMHKVSLFHLIVSLILVYFSRTTGQMKIALGVPVLNRTKKIYRQTAGVFMNLLSIPFETPSDNKFSSLLAGVKQKMSSVLRHQRYQYGNLVRDLKSDTNRRLLYDIRISYEDFEFTADFGGLRAGAIAISNCAEVDPLAIYVREYHGLGFDIRFIYNTSCFNRKKIQSISHSLSHIMKQMVAGSGIPLDQLDLVDPAEKYRILTFCSGEKRDWPDKSFTSLWRKSVLAYSDRIAISCNGRTFTYKQTDLLIRRVSSALQAIAPAEEAISIALLLTRSEYMVTAMIGSILAGYCYIPIDPEYPEERIKYILEDAGCSVLLTDVLSSCNLENVPGLRVLRIEEIMKAPAGPFPEISSIDPGRPCYIIYTSGSTGQPKGVLISNESLADYANTVRTYFHLNEEDVVLQHSSICFDTSVEEIFPVLAAGGRLHILENRKDLEALQLILERERITVLSTSPWVIRFLQQAALPVSLRLIISGGDILKREYINNILQQGIDVYNTYGPTESTVCATYYKVDTDDIVIPIGHAITNKRVYVLDNYMKLQPFGVEGEIYIAGKGLAIGYLGKPSLNIEKFIEDLLVPGEKMYKTGDLGIMEDDGNIIFKGRKDEQLNYRGYRIETQEIEIAIQSQTNVEDCMVEVREWNGSPLLVAYIQYQGDYLRTAADWKQLLVKKLPAYMIPEVWIRINELPLLPNGKINRRALPQIDERMADGGTEEKIFPRTPEERQLHDLWQELVKKNYIGIDDSFFESGGHSLNLVQLLTAIKKKFRVEIKLYDLFENDTIRKQAAFLLSADGLNETPEYNAPLLKDYPLTAAQQYIWIVSQLKEASLAYHISGAIRMKGPVNAKALQKSVEMIVTRHESLHTLFMETDQGIIRQKIVDPEAFKESIFSFRSVNVHQEDIIHVLADIAALPFDLAQGPLVRTVLLELGTSDYVFVYVLHHIISDGWSIELLLREYVAGYNALATGEPINLPPLKQQFRHYLSGETDMSKTADGAAKTYWTHKFQGRIPLVDLPAQHTRPAIKTYKGNQVVKDFDKEHYSRLLGFCEKEGVTIFTALFATLNVLIHRYTGQEESIIGTPVANRDQDGQQEQIGLFLDILPIRTIFFGQQSFREIVKVQNEELVLAYKFHRYPLHELLHSINYRQDPSRSPLFDILMVLHNQQNMTHFEKGLPGCHMAGVEIEVFDRFPRHYSQFDMSFSFFYEKDSLQLRLDYNTDLFDEWFVNQMADHYIRLSMQALENPDHPIDRLSYFIANGLQFLSSPDNNEHSPERAPSEWMEYLLYWSTQDPGRDAVVGGDIRISYAALLQAAKQTGGYLTQVRGLLPGERVGVLLEPGAMFPSLLLGIWMAGGIYVPVNTDHPEARQRMIIDDAACRFVINSDELEIIADYLPDDCPALSESSSIAYILYTSGTTGKPKGAAISHDALLLKLQAEITYMPQQTPINSCLITNYCFDVCFLELLLPLMTGGKIVIPPRSLIADPERLATVLIDERINVLHGTPTFLDSFFRYLPERCFAGLNTTISLICIGGESLYKKLVDFLRAKLPLVQINNHYGPTEAIIHALVFPGIQSFDRNIIGRNMPGVRIFVVDKHLQLQPPGIRGELLVGGDRALAEGYINMQDETSRKFLDNPWIAGEKVYRTGDMVRWTNDGYIEFLGRSDDQVKIRGLRIELDEIQRILEQHPSIDQAVIIPYGTGDHTILTAFYVASATLDERGIKIYLRTYLPDYMIPTLYKHVRIIPLNENGKVDKEDLLRQVNPDEGRNEIMPARNELERQLVKIWEELLNRSPIGIKCNFYDLGGNSILLIRLRAELKKELNIRLNVRALLSVLTIEDMAETIESFQWVQGNDIGSENQLLQEFVL